MKVCILGDAGSIHTQRWAMGLKAKGLDIIVISYKNKEIPGVPVYLLKSPRVNKISPVSPLWSRFHYFFGLKQTKDIINEFKPDILHAHWATSYGLLGARTNFHPFILSVWGSDVFEFPNISYFHKKLFQFNLKKADKLLSTSHIMAREIKKYTEKSIEVTPFGVNIEKFKPKKIKNLFSDDNIVIGTVKTLEHKYGIEYLIRAFKILVNNHADLPLKLLIVGSGSLINNLKSLVSMLHLEDKTIFTGSVEYDKVPDYHNMLSVSVSVSVSNSESFGVAIVEASACGKAVVVSDVGGLPEVVENTVSGFVVPPRNPEATAKAIEKLILDRDLREKMGGEGRKRVERLYDWANNVNQMIKIYEKLSISKR